MPKTPRSAFDLTGGLVYFARMCDKIRLHHAGKLPEDYHPFLGAGFDGRICGYLKVDYAAVRDKVLAGASDEETLEWCQENGRRLAEIDVIVWNGFARKRGWRDTDGGTEKLAEMKQAAGFGDRDDIVTFYDFYDFDEGRRA
ncbi:DUF5069 domain-containing protein [Luteolibacter sp. LG18]|uniref:DUF5069 domain-containing protein n=1 Tax=Luteolibacter sp. LG18 TaxID=2819286 RepID=UPI002B29551D|nr:hypothetical protein llg_32150 [Luteolibacter sp. LG18]